MDVICQTCRRQSPLYLCTDCTSTLTDMLTQIPFLAEELDTRIQKLDRINLGTIGRNRRPDELNVMDFDAAEQSRKLRKLLLHWVTTIATRHAGRPPHALSTVRTGDLALWLAANTKGIARLDLRDPRGGHQLFNDIRRLVGTDTQRTGTLVTAINPRERHFAGPCPTIRGYRGNDPIECNTLLYADIDQITVRCPTCKQDIKVEDNRLKARIDRDLLTEPKLREVMASLGETVSRTRFYAWRMRPRGWMHDGQFVKRRVSQRDPAVYSLRKARRMWARDNHTATEEAAAQ